MNQRRFFLKMCCLSAMGLLPMAASCNRSAPRTPERPVGAQEATMTTMPQLKTTEPILPRPPIDAAAPAQFETATFALG